MNRIALCFLAIPLLHCDAASPSTLGVLQAPPPMDWYVEPMVLGETFSARVSGGPPNSPIVFVASSNVGGQDACPPQIAPTCMSVPAPFVVLAQGQTDATGAHTFTLNVPPSLPFDEAVVQAVSIDRGTVFLTPGRTAPIYAAPADMSIPDIRTTANIDDLVRASGIVTGVAPAGYFIQGAGSVHAGLWVFSGLNATKPAVGDEVTVIGTFGQYDGSGTNGTASDSLAQIGTRGPAHVVLSSTNPLPAATSISLRRWTDLTLMEGLESMRVRISGVTTDLMVDDSLGFGEYTVHHGGTAAIVDDLLYRYETEIPTWSVNDEMRSIQGVLNYSFGNFKIEPGVRGDIDQYVDYSGWLGTYVGDIDLEYYTPRNGLQVCTTPFTFDVDRDGNVTASGTSCLGRSASGVATLDDATNTMTGTLTLPAGTFGFDASMLGEPEDTTTAALLVDTDFDDGTNTMVATGTAALQ